MNQVVRCQAEMINGYFTNNQSLELREFMTDMHMPVDRQDRVLSAITQLSKPSAKKVGIILELANDPPFNEDILK